MRFNAQGKETRVRWNYNQFNTIARYFLDRRPNLAMDEELKGISVQDILDVQVALFAEDQHRSKENIKISTIRKNIWQQMLVVFAERAAEKQAAEQIEAGKVPVFVAKADEEIKPLPPTPEANQTPVSSDTKQVFEHEEGESQLMFLPPVGQDEPHPAYATEKPAPMLDSHRIAMQMLSRQINPESALQELGNMKAGGFFDLLVDKVADRVADRVMERIEARLEVNLTEQIGSVLGQLGKGNMGAMSQLSKHSSQAKVEEKPVQAKQLEVKPQEKGSMKDQLKEVLAKAPKLRKPKIAVIGLQGHQKTEIDKEFDQFEIVHFNHANDKTLRDLEGVSKVVAVEPKIGQMQRKLRQAFGTNFTIVNFSLSSVRRTLDIWATCYNEDPAYFKMCDVERAKANEQYASA